MKKQYISLQQHTQQKHKIRHSPQLFFLLFHQRAGPETLKKSDTLKKARMIII